MDVQWRRSSSPSPRISRSFSSPMALRNVRYNKKRKFNKELTLSRAVYVMRTRLSTSLYHRLAVQIVGSNSIDKHSRLLGQRFQVSRGECADFNIWKMPVWVERFQFFDNAVELRGASAAYCPSQVRGELLYDMFGRIFALLY